MEATEAKEAKEPTEATEPNSREVEVVLAGIGIWVLAAIVLAVFFRHDLERHDATWWYWSCGCGVLLGLYGLRTALRRRDR